MKTYNIETVGYTAKPLFEAKIDVTPVADLAAGMLKYRGITSEVQRHIIDAKLKAIANSHVYLLPNGKNMKNKPVGENAPLNIHHINPTLAVFDDAIMYDASGRPKAILIPETDAEIEAWCNKYDIVDNQHSILAFHPAVCLFGAKTMYERGEGIKFTFKLMLNPTIEEMRDEFRRANFYITKASTTLNESHDQKNGNKSPSEDFAYDLIRLLANEPVDMGKSMGIMYSPIFGNVDMGLKEGKYKIDKLVEAISGTTGNLMEYYVETYPGKSRDFILTRAHKDMTLYMTMLNTVDASPAHGGTGDIFGENGARKTSKNSIFETKEVEGVPNVRVKGKNKREVHYLFGMTRAVMEYCGEKKTMAKMRNAVEEMLAIRGIKFVGDDTLVGQGGQDVYAKAREDSHKLIAKAHAMI